MSREIFNYVLGTYRRRLKMLGIWDVRNYFSDHFALQAILLHLLKQFQDSYLRIIHAFPLYLPALEDFRLAENIFE